MTSQKTLLTYKRKRFSTQDDHVHAVKEANASPNSLIRGVSLGRSQPKSLDSNSENMNEDSLNDPQKELQYPSSEAQDSEEQVQEKKRTKRNESVKTYKLGPMKLRSQKELSCRKVAEKGSRKASPSSAYACVSKTAGSPLIDISCTNAGSSLKAIDVEGNSRSMLPNEDGIKSSPICLVSSAENKFCSGCSDSISRIINSDNMLLSKEPLKENYTPPLITFYRRVRKKQIISEAPAESNLKAGGNQGSAVNLSSKHALEASPEHDKSSRKSIFKDQPTTATVSEHADISKLHGLQHDAMANADKDLTPDSALAGGFPETKIAGDKLGGSSFHHAKGSNSNCVEYNHEEPSNTFVAAPTKNAPGNPILMHEDRQYFPATGGTDSRDELRSNLSEAVDISGIMITPHIVPESRCQTSDLNLSATACPNNDNSNKPFADVVPENLLESQSSSTPSCAVVDDEVDGRGKELEWLESLDKSLQEAKEKRNTCLVRGQDDNNCGSSGWASHLIPTKSPVHSPCNQDQYKDYTRQTTREFLSLSGKPGDEKQRLEHKSNMSSLRTNFIDLALPLNCRMPVGSAKDFRNMHSRLNLGLEEAEGPMRSVQAPWHTLGESSSLCRHKKIVEDVITGTRMLKERQGFFLDKYRRYSLEWSEEELDFLWIGVRRYGIHNWSAMLRDPKLCFSEFRVPEDLARRWDLEQTKMFSSPLAQPASLTLFSSSLPMDLEKPAAGGYGASSQSYQDFPVTAAETRLSLGDVYLRKGPNLDSSQFHHSSGLGTTNLMSNAGPSTLPFSDSSLIGSSNPNAGIRQKKPTRLRNTRSLWRPYILRRKSFENASPENQPAGVPTSTSTIPHWLRQHVIAGTHSDPRESALPPVSTTSQSTIPLNNDVPVGVPFPNLAEQSVPLKVARRPGILRRKGTASRNRAAALRASEVLGSTNEPWTATRLDSLPSLGLASQKPPSADPGPSQSSICDLNKKVPAPNEPSDLVVIDSDASSEETISDAQGSKN